MKRLSLLLLLIAAPVFAQPELERSTYIQVLVPVLFGGPIPGAQGSVWVSELWYRNDGNTSVIVSHGTPECHVGCDGQVTLQRVPPKTTRELSVRNAGPPGSGALLYVEKTGFDQMFFAGRVRDISRSTLSLGTELPIVRETETFTRPVVLLNVPGDPNFRLLLRVFGVSGAPERVRVRIVRMDTNEVLQTGELQLTSGDPDPIFPAHPSYAEAPLNVPVGIERVYVEIERLTLASRIWAMVSVTNNATQEVALITPR